MSSSKIPRITGYIEDAAASLSKDFKWEYVNVYSSASLATLTTLKSSRLISQTYTINTNKIITSQSALFKLLGMRFLKKVTESGSTELLTGKIVPSDNHLFVNIFTQVVSSIYQDMLVNMEKKVVDRKMSYINLIYEATLVFCWHFLNISHSKNNVDKVIEELYLLKEIEVFKNRKGE
jgi:hypothetical protein